MKRPSSADGGTVKDENKMKVWKAAECVTCEINVQAVLCSSVDRDSKVWMNTMKEKELHYNGFNTSTAVWTKARTSQCWKPFIKD